MKALVLPALAALALAGAPAAQAQPQNHTVTLHVPVDISAMPYVKTLSVQCYLSYADGGQMGYQRKDLPLTSGEFHGQVDLALTAPDFREGPTGWFCDLFVFPSTTKPGFKPKPWGDASVPPEQHAAQGTAPVTHVEGTFGPKTLAKPQGPATTATPPPIRRVFPPAGQTTQPATPKPNR